MQDSPTTILNDNDERWMLVYAKKLENDVVDAFNLFREHGIEPVLIKGWATMRKYPRHHFRFYQDIDLCVSGADHPTARTLKSGQKGKHLMIDLHRELRHLDSRPWRDLIADSCCVELDGTQVRVLAEEDHLRVLATHWLTDGGERKDRLWDIYYSVQNRSANFDWDKCLGTVPAHRAGWVAAAVRAAVDYLGLEGGELPEAIRQTKLPRWFARKLERIWAEGYRSNMLALSINDRREFWRQLRRKFPPNPIQATIENDGDLFGSRIPFYQVSSISRRAMPSITAVARKVLYGRG